MLRFSISEEHGLRALPADATKIYSVGISTAGATEIQMARQNPLCHIIATTIDEAGAAATQKYINQEGLSDRIEVKIEDVSKPLPYRNGYFDYIYARLVLHYLNRQQLAAALAELHRILKSGGQLFVVVRSINNLDATRDTSTHEESTGMTTYLAQPNKDVRETRSRFFHSEESLSKFVIEAGFQIEHITTYEEKLFHDYNRTVTVDYADNLIELLASK